MAKIGQIQIINFRPLISHTQKLCLREMFWRVLWSLRAFFARAVCSPLSPKPLFPKHSSVFRNLKIHFGAMRATFFVSVNPTELRVYEPLRVLKIVSGDTKGTSSKRVSAK